MLYVYMNNYRGFSRTVVPINACSFLVGENSTGKSSFLHLLRLIGRPNFWFFPRFSLSEEDSLGGFSDIVSAWASDKSSFDVGIANTRKLRNGQRQLEFAVHRFVDKGGVPTLASHVQAHDGKGLHILFGNRKTEYVARDSQHNFPNEEKALAHFLEQASAIGSPVTPAKVLPKSVPPNAPLALAVSIIRTIEAGEKPQSNELKAEIPIAIDLTWIAPIRTRPQRIYDGLTREYSAEGEHSPYVLRTHLKSERFAKKLAAFGDASSLFETVVTHTFGKGARNPFEVMIRLSGADLNINNVGYGVSQALPLVIEFLSKEKAGMFAVQQPEVHLHPKAQAALGSLLFDLSSERKHSFLVETHSDYLIDRFRFELSKAKSPPESQVLFFSRSKEGNCVTPLAISQSGQYPDEQPKEFRAFFLNEEMRLLSL